MSLGRPVDRRSLLALSAFGTRYVSPEFLKQNNVEFKKLHHFTILQPLQPV